MTDTNSKDPTLGIGKVIQNGKFAVPSHQRDYSWTTDEVKQLIDDAEEAMAEGKPYFLGLLVLLENDERLTILDGQQRLATVTIFFAAIRDWLKQYDDKSGDAAKIQDWYIGASKLGQHEPTPRVALNTSNNPKFESYVVGSTPVGDVKLALTKLKRHDPNRKLLEAIIYCHDHVREIAASKENAESARKYLFEMIEFFEENIKVVRLVVADESAAYILFETLNDRGVDLSPLDLAKNFLFRQASGISPTALKDMQARWIAMIATLSNVQATQFLKTFWTSRHGRTRTNLLFDAFSKANSSSKKAIETSKDMAIAAEHYAALESSEDTMWSQYSKETKATISALKILGSQQARPVILSGLAKFSPSEMQKLLRLLEVCIVRFLLVLGKNPGRFEPACAKLAQEIFDGNVATAKQAFMELKAAEVFPNDAEFQAAFATKSERTSQKAQYFLRALEIEMQRKKAGSMANELLPGMVTVEHILPKNPGTDWDAQIKSDKDFVDDFVLRLGNMCLLTDINSKLGNKGFLKKKAVFKISKLASTKQVSTYSTWDRKTIESRQKKMAELAVKIWSFS